LLIVVCAPTIAVTAGVFIATAAARGGSMAVAAAATAMPAAVAMPAAAALPPSPRYHRASRRGAGADDATLPVGPNAKLLPGRETDRRAPKESSRDVR